MLIESKTIFICQKRDVIYNVICAIQELNIIIVFCYTVVAALTESDSSQRINQEANLAAECGMIILDVLGLYCINFRVSIWS